MTERTQALAALEQGCNFCMEMTGDSMAPKILDGDVVFFAACDHVDSGQIAAVRLDGEILLRRVQWVGEWLMLAPFNPAYPPCCICPQEQAAVEIVGRAVVVRRLVCPPTPAAAVP